ncbi:MAG: hydrogenase maturation protease [Candidatus Tectimicrobiota bacterium]
MTPQPPPPGWLVIGIGNAWRGDDALGLVAARRLRALLPAQVSIVEASGDGTSLLTLWAGADQVILIDAVQSGAPPGTVQRFTVHTAPLPSHTFRMSTHAFGLAEGIELARALGQLPAVCLVYGIEGSVWERGAALSPAVEASVQEVVRRVQEDVRL